MPFSKYHAVPCPKCGKPMHFRSRLAPNALLLDVAGKLRPARGCGNSMDHRAKLCRCTHGARERHVDPLTRTWWGSIPDYSHLPVGFLQTFAGFFMAEGHVKIATEGPGQDASIMLSQLLAASRLSVDLELAQQMFGVRWWPVRGTGNSQGYQSKPQVFWYLQGMGNNLMFLQLMAKCASVLETKKLADVRITIEYINGGSVGRRNSLAMTGLPYGNIGNVCGRRDSMERSSIRR